MAVDADRAWSWFAAAMDWAYIVFFAAVALAFGLMLLRLVFAAPFALWEWFAGLRHDARQRRRRAMFQREEFFRQQEIELNAFEDAGGRLWRPKKGATAPPPE